MGTRQLTEEEIKALVWIKVLNDFDDGDFKGASFAEKFRNFDVTTLDFKPAEFAEGIKGLCELKIIEIKKNDDEEEPDFRLTTKGKAVMIGLSAIKNFEYDAVELIINGSIGLGNFVEKHGKEIAEIVVNLAK